MFSTVRRAPVIVFVVRVVAKLAWVDDPVATFDGRLAGFSRLFANTVGFQTAGTVTTVPRNAVAVVTIFALIEFAITTGRSGIGHFAAEPGYLVTTTGIGHWQISLRRRKNVGLVDEPAVRTAPVRLGVIRQEATIELLIT